MKASQSEHSSNQDQFELIRVKQLTELLIKHYELKSGFYELGVHFGMGNGNFKNPSGDLIPGVFFGLDALSLVETSPDNPGAVDAAKCNPPKKATKAATETSSKKIKSSSK